MRAHLANDNVIKTLYNYFKNLPGAASFRGKLIPKSPAFKEALKAETDIVERWLCEFNSSHQGEANFEISSQALFKVFHEWCKATNNSCPSDASFFKRLKDKARKLGVVIEESKFSSGPNKGLKKKTITFTTL